MSRNEFFFKIHGFLLPDTTTLLDSAEYICLCSKRKAPQSSHTDTFNVI